MIFLPIEKLIFTIITALLVFDVFWIYQKSIYLDVGGYFFSAIMGLIPLALGQFYRLRGREAGLGDVLTASGLYILFTIAASVFNYMFLPISFEPIDEMLMRADNALGHSWPDIVTWISQYPLVGTALHYVYLTSLPQLLVTIIVLGFTGKQRALNWFLLTGSIGALLSICFWIFFPTFGAKAYHDLTPEVVAAIPLAVDPAYGQELMRLGREGVAYLSPRNILGLIGFPSFHIFMALMSVFFVPRHTFFIAVFGTLNALMLPAVLIQGGHHLVDIFGGMICFAITLPISRYIVERLNGKEMTANLKSNGAELAAD